MTQDTTDRPTWSLRLRKQFDEWGVLVVVALVMLGLLGAWVAYGTHVAPGTETETVVDSTWSEQGSVSHAATITQPNPVFAEGQTLSDQPVYFTQLAPELDGTFEYTYDASESGSLDVVTEATLRMRSVNDDGNSYWSVTESLGGDSVEGLSPGEVATTTATVEIESLLAELQAIESDLGTSVGSTEADIVFDTQVAGEVNGERVTRTHQQTLTLNPGSGTYDVSTGEAISETYESTSSLRTEATDGPLRSYGSVALILVAATGLVGFAAARYWGVIPLSPAERATLVRHRERRDFDDWISTGTVPAEARTGAAIQLDSLEDLVDVAIDTNERVIEDTETGDFCVVDNGRHYIYSSDWLIDDPDFDRLSMSGTGTEQSGGETATATGELRPDSTETDGGTHVDSGAETDGGTETEAGQTGSSGTGDDRTNDESGSVDPGD